MDPVWTLPVPTWPEKGKRGHHLSYPSSVLVERWLEASPFGHFLRELRVHELGSLTSPLPRKSCTSGSHSSWFLIFNSQPLPDATSGVPAVVIESRPPITMGDRARGFSKFSECSRPPLVPCSSCSPMYEAESQQVSAEEAPQTGQAGEGHVVIMANIYYPLNP